MKIFENSFKEISNIINTNSLLTKFIKQSILNYSLLRTKIYSIIKPFLHLIFTETDINELDKSFVLSTKKEIRLENHINKIFLLFFFLLTIIYTAFFLTTPSVINIPDFLHRSNYEITAGTEMLKAILTLYSNMVVVLFVIGVLVTSILLDSVFFYQDTNITSKRAFVVHNQPLEFIWTTIPAVIVTLIAIPTLMWIYLSDRDLDPTISISVTGHQWYWNYKILNKNLMMSDVDSFMLPATVNVEEVEDFINDPSYNYLKTDNYLVIPSIQKLRFTVTSNDVIHSWAIPALGIKVDAVPGRATRLDVSINQEGLFYGQCSELCGVNHAFMPIGVDVTGAKHFLAHTRV